MKSSLFDPSNRTRPKFLFCVDQFWRYWRELGICQTFIYVYNKNPSVSVCLSVGMFVPPSCPSSPRNFGPFCTIWTKLCTHHQSKIYKMKFINTYQTPTSFPANERPRAAPAAEGGAKASIYNRPSHFEQRAPRFLFTFYPPSPPPTPNVHISLIQPRSFWLLESS